MPWLVKEAEYTEASLSEEPFEIRLMAAASLELMAAWKKHGVGNIPRRAHLLLLLTDPRRRTPKKRT
jgi:hypothetical protein